jgi:hypothetical protein
VDIVKEVNRLINIKEGVGVNIVDKVEQDKKILKKVWYLKWASSIILLGALILTANNVYPANLFLGIIGFVGWLGVSIAWKDRSLIVLNSVSLAIYLNGIVGFYVN